jgi:DNA-3-methyladenine glycosylase I
MVEMRVEPGPDNRVRCWWGNSAPEYIPYHDREWGRPVVDDTRLFEKLSLEGFQAGLSWLTILRKRPAFREAFAGFDIPAVARFDEADVARLLADAGIVRHEGKIRAAIGNARNALDLIDEHGSLSGYVWSYRPDDHAVDLRSTSPESVAMSKDLKRRGWRFVGPTTIYAFMQAMGLVNDHLPGCWVQAEVETERASLLSSGTDPDGLRLTHRNGGGT